MKTTFKTSEIAHAWFHGLAPHGKSSSAMSFDGALIRSYGTGIARKVEHKGKQAVIINDSSFSVTTSAHQGRMRGAIPLEAARFHVSEAMGASLNLTGAELFEYAVEQSADALAKAGATKHPKYRERMNGTAGYWLEEASKVNEFFGLRRKVDMKTAQRLQASKEREEKRQAVERAKREDAERAKQQVAYLAWINGEDEGYFMPSLFPVAFRVEGDELVSSLGARVPVKEAKAALRFVQSRKGKEWRSNGETCPVGGYKVDSIMPQGIVAGCHRITWEEVAHVATLL